MTMAALLNQDVGAQQICIPDRQEARECVRERDRKRTLAAGERYDGMIITSK